jgi:outer membrane protein OmpA-like peptidoglycan-associated protein
MTIGATMRVFLALCLAVWALPGCRDVLRDIDDPLNELTPAAGISQPSTTIYFAAGSAHLTKEALRIIREVAATVVASGTTTTIHVTGHTDTIGSVDNKERLSQRRARSVANVLAANGVRRDRISIDWTGEREPPISTADGIPEPANRVVTIKL